MRGKYNNRSSISPLLPGFRVYLTDERCLFPDGSWRLGDTIWSFEVGILGRVFGVGIFDAREFCLFLPFFFSLWGGGGKEGCLMLGMDGRGLRFL